MPCEIISGHVDEPLLYWATDLSPQGLWLDTRFPMQAGEQVVVCFKPAVWWPGRELMVFAQVIRASASRARSGLASAGMGLEFLDIDCHEQRALTAWLRRRPPPLPRRRARGVPSLRALPEPRYAVAC